MESCGRAPWINFDGQVTLVTGAGAGNGNYSD